MRETGTGLEIAARTMGTEKLKIEIYATIKSITWEQS
jgi:ABC-type sulfate transport system permease subunit